MLNYMCMKKQVEKTYSFEQAKEIVRAKISETSRELGVMIRAKQKQQVKSVGKKSRVYA